MKSRNLLVIVIVSALLGGVFGSLISAETSRANFFEDILKFFQPVEIGWQEETVPSGETGLYKPALDYEEAVIAAVEEAAPSVVSIAVTKDLPIIVNCQRDPFEGVVPPEFWEFFGGFDFSVPCEQGTERKEVGGGSGFVVSEDGLILTNKHVVADTEAEYTVLTNDGEKYEARVLARDPVQDIAIIKIEAQGLKPAKLGDSDSIKLGQTAISIGNSLGEFRNTVSVGVISGLSRTITASGEGIGTEVIQGVIQTDAAINPGNSGGPLLNLKGEVIGINVAVVSDAQSIGFAIPVNFARRDIESVKISGDIKVPYLGVRYLSEEEGARLRGNEDGPAVMPGSPAEVAGLKAEDIILELNGEKVSSEKLLGFLIQKYNIGDTVTLKIKRGEEALELKATLEERPELP
ncbi:MAG: trypsin-like peptidase domain-containing protein [Candidatus Jorgensenbacteria bacterium]